MEQINSNLPSAVQLVTQRDLTPFTCLSCRASFLRPEELLAHLDITSWVHPSACFYQAKSEKKIDQVDAIESPQCKFTCLECHKNFDSEKGLRLHSGKKHPDQEKKETCLSCGGKFIHKYALDFHIKQVHERSTRINCHKCNKSLYNKYVLQHHIKKCNGFHSLV